MSENLSSEQFDAVIVYSQEDADITLAKNAKIFLEKYLPPLADGQKTKVCVFDKGDLLHITDRFDQLEEAQNRSTYTFILLTPHFIQSYACNLVKNALLQSTIDDEDKRQCLIPMYDHKGSVKDKDVPLFLKSFRPVYLNQLVMNSDKFSCLDLSHNHPMPNLDMDEVNKLVKLFNRRLGLKQKRLEQSRLHRSQSYDVQHNVPKVPSRQHSAVFISQPSDDTSGQLSDMSIALSSNRVFPSQPLDNTSKIGDSGNTAMGTDSTPDQFPDLRLAPPPNISFPSQSMDNASKIDNTESTAAGFSMGSYPRPEHPNMSMNIHRNIGSFSNNEFSSLRLSGGETSGETLMKHVKHPDKTSEESSQYQTGDLNISGFDRGPVILTKSERGQLQKCIEKSWFREGGFSHVYRGSWRGKNVAIKVLKDLGLQTQKQSLKEKSVAYVRHPFLLPYLAMSSEVPIPKIFIFPFKNGKDLRELLLDPQNFPDYFCTWKDFLRVLLQISMALDFLHSRVAKRGPIRHGDVKPASILLDDHGNACLGNAGLAVEIPRDRDDVTGTANTGTRDYIDYDHSRGKSPMNDIYSFGIVTEEIVTLTVGESHSTLATRMNNCGGRTRENISKFRKHRDHAAWEGMPENVMITLIDIILGCVKPIDERIAVRDIVTRLRQRCHESAPDQAGSHAPYVWSQGEDLCVMCQFYAPAERSDCCKCDVPRFCTGCLSQNSVNPLYCPACGPCQPNIGGEHKFALLVAGGGQGSDVFMEDVLRMKRVLLDTRVVGIRDENLITLLPDQTKKKKVPTATLR